MKIEDSMAMESAKNDLVIKDKKAFIRGKKAILSAIKRQKNQLKKKMKGMGNRVALDPA
jgi:hypothetical protein